MEPQLHRIERLVFKLRFPSEKSAMDARRLLSPFLTGENYEKQMDEMLSGFNTNREIIHIDQIDLDLGTIQMDDFPVAVRQKFIPLLEEKLKEKLAGRALKETGLRVMTRVTSYLEDFIHFLETGQRSWWSSLNSLAELESQLITGNAFTSGSARGSLQAILENPDARKRLALQFSPGFQMNLVKALFPGHFPIVEMLVGRFPGIVTKGISPDPDRIKRELLSASWNQLLKLRENIPSAGFPGHIMAEWCTMADVHPEKILTEIRPYLSPESLVILEQAEIKKMQEAKIIKEPLEEIEQRYTVSNAGLVILWPYLEPLFKTLGYLEEGKFVNTGLHERALGITQFLVTGEDYMEEHLLLLNKIITGWPSGMPVRSRFSFTEEEKQECDRLLNSAIRNWPVLKNTSVAGLRETFLARTGRLHIKENEYFLRIERSGLDVLLDQLPWTISVIGFPWIRSILYVEW